MWLWLLVALAVISAVLYLWNLLTTPKPWNPSGKSILITGGSSGIGKATAIALVGMGANVTILSRTLSRLKEAKKEIKKARKQPSSQRVRILVADVAKGDDLVRSVQSHVEKFGPFDTLITSAGATGPQYFEDIDLAEFERLMAINYFGTVASVKAVLPSMKTRKSGNIVFISSMAGQLGIFGYSSYAPTKFALRGLADCLYHELLPYNISVSLSYPPDTDTPMFVEENKIKPVETKLLSEGTGVLSAEAVAATLIDGMMHHRYHIYHSLEGRAVAIATTGMSPSAGVLNSLLEMVALPILRVVAVFTQWNFGRIIRKCAAQKSSQRKTK